MQTWHTPASSLLHICGVRPGNCTMRGASARNERKMLESKLVPCMSASAQLRSSAPLLVQLNIFAIVGHTNRDSNASLYDLRDFICFPGD